MATFYECRICKSCRIPYDDMDLCVFCLARGEVSRIDAAKNASLETLLEGVFPDGVIILPPPEYNR